jgi:hypothetical protein
MKILGDLGYLEGGETVTAKGENIDLSTQVNFLWL